MMLPPTTIQAFVLSLLLLLLIVAQLHGVNANNPDDGSEYPLTARRSSTTNSRPCLVCDVGAADVQYPVGQTNGTIDEFFVCMTNSSQEPDGKANRIYRLDSLPQRFIQRYRTLLTNGRTRICIPKGILNRQSHSVDIPNGTEPTLLLASTGNGRRLQTKTGVLTVVVVRVTTTAGEDPGNTASELEGAIFGTGSAAQNASLASQYAACSQGKLNLQPATGNNLVNGVVEVEFSGTVAGGDIQGALQTAIYSATQSRLGVSDLSKFADHFLFCLPTGSYVHPNITGWIAFSYLSKWQSFFQRGWCMRLSAQVHEFGHQLGFRHSGKGSSQYGDQSCMMGSSYNVTSRPQMCFNGHKNWISTWFDDTKITVNPVANGPWAGNLVAFVDAPLMSQVLSSVVLLQVGDLYIVYNGAKKYNYQVVANANQVTVVKFNATAQFSDNLAGLYAGQNYIYSNFTGTGTGLVIQVCSVKVGTVNYAKISLYLEDGIQQSQCSVPLGPSTPPPTPLPTSPPTPLPTRLPTRPPTRLPTHLPTRIPSPSPTRLPTRLPTRPPTRLPTRTPTPPPTPRPTVPPLVSARPTATITLSPTVTPSSQPSPATASPSVTPITRSPSLTPITQKPSVTPITQTPSLTPSAVQPHAANALQPSSPPLPPFPPLKSYPNGTCFSAANMVKVQHKGFVAMKDIQIGDMVRSAGNKTARVYGFGHYNHETKAEFLQIFIQDRHLEISSDHLVFIEGSAAVPASSIRVGHRLQTENGDVAEVKKIRTVVRSGVYAPLTTSGTIVVSGVTASSYVTLQEGSSVLVVGGHKTLLSMQWLSHIFQSPHRLVCLVSPRSCDSETYTQQGISKWLEGPWHVFKWLLRQNGLVMSVILFPAILLALACFAIEFICLSGRFLLVGAVGVVVLSVVSVARFRKYKAV